MYKVDLFTFSSGNKTWNFTSAPQKILKAFGSTWHYPLVLGRSAIEDADIDKSEVEIRLPYPHQLLNENGDDLYDLLINKIYLSDIHVTIAEQHNTTSTAILVIFKGRVIQPKFDEEQNIASLICSTSESYLNRNILNRQVQRSCANKLYDRFCGLNREDFAIEITVQKIINQTTIEYTTTAESKPFGYFSRGLLYKDGVYTFISNDDGRLHLYRPHVGLKVGDVVKIYAGCDNSLKTCQQKFNNTLNFCGFPNIPSQNPLSQQIF